MTVELARRLILSGVLSREEVEAALLVAATGGLPFAQALRDARPDAATLVDQELARLGLPTLPTVRAATELVRDLPEGMCARLLAVPVGRDSATECIDIAAVDPLDHHVTDEFAYHFAAAVSVQRAPLQQVEAALSALPFASSDPPTARMVDEAFDDRTPAFGTYRAPTSSSPVARVSAPSSPRTETERPPPITSAPSEPPIPLVRRSAEHPTVDPFAERSGGKFETRPGVGGSPKRALVDFGQDEEGEPIIGLLRPKRPRPDGDGAEPSEPMDAALDALDEAETPEAVAAQLVKGARLVCGRAIVFSVSGSLYQGRTASSETELAAIQSLHIPRARSSIFDAALCEGHYLGPVPTTRVHEELRRLLASASDEVYVAPICVSDRPALMLLLAAMGSSFEATRAISQLVRKAGLAIERILLAKRLF